MVEPSGVCSQVVYRISKQTQKEMPIPLKVIKWSFPEFREVGKPMVHPPERSTKADLLSFFFIIQPHVQDTTTPS